MGTVKKEFTFPKSEKLKGKKAFDLLFAHGKTLNVQPIQLRYLPMEYEGDSRIKVAVVAPKRKFKKAYQRNRVKRLLREAYRRNKSVVFNNIEGSFALLFLYIGNSMPTPVEVEKAVQQLLQDFVKKQRHEKNS
ncbi:ribonuclease P protein component [Flagellimonas sp.]|uniref:ribonuclease P protein component n=1 Tax=Flagellimonas sp. TaxID=2058762 RepID=UPI003F4A32AF